MTMKSYTTAVYEIVRWVFRFASVGFLFFAIYFTYRLISGQATELDWSDIAFAVLAAILSWVASSFVSLVRAIHDRIMDR